MAILAIIGISVNLRILSPQAAISARSALLILSFLPMLEPPTNGVSPSPQVGISDGIASRVVGVM